MPAREICRRGPSEARGRIPRLALLALLLTPAAPALAASDAEVEGAHISLRAIETEGAIRAALEIELKPGWKTYWISPGAAGLAPRLDLGASTGVSGTEVSYPVPARFPEGEIESVGYGEPVSFAIEAQRLPGPRPVLRAQILLGLCRDLCLPVQLALEAEPESSLGARAAVRRAFDALPTPAAAAVGWEASLSADAATLTLDAPSDALGKARDLFVAAPEGWAFGKPAISIASDRARAKLPVLSRPSGAAMLRRVNLVLTDGEKGELIRAVPVNPG